MSDRVPTYCWVRVDLACLTGEGMVVGMGWWPAAISVPEVRPIELAQCVVRACTEWLEHQGADLRSPGGIMVRPTGVRLPDPLHTQLLRRYRARGPHSAAQIWPHPRALPLPKEVDYVR
jgi:hypothetical protein